MKSGEENSFLNKIMRGQFERAYGLKEGEYEELTPLMKKVVDKDYLKYLDNPTIPIKAPRYVDLFGEEITFEKRAKLFENHDYKSISRTEINGYLVSTIRLGLNHGSNEYPLYFETMIFKITPDGFDSNDLFCKRYTTKSEAIDYHKEIISYMKKTNLLPNEFLPGKIKK